MLEVSLKFYFTRATGEDTKCEFDCPISIIETGQNFAEYLPMRQQFNYSGRKV